MSNKNVTTAEYKIDDNTIIVGTFKNGSLTRSELYNIFKAMKNAVPNKPIIFVPDEISVKTMTIENLISFRDNLSKIIDDYNKET